MDYSLLSHIALGIALSACTGFRVFIPLLAGAVAGHFGIINLAEDMTWLQSWPSILLLTTAALAEVMAYYIPFVDNLLDTIATPLAVAAGTVLASSILPVTDLAPPLRWGIGLLAGGSLAGTIQMGTGLLRLLSSKTTIGTGNAVVATTENVAAVSGSLFAFLIPVLVALVLIIFTIWAAIKIVRGWQARRKRSLEADKIV